MPQAFRGSLGDRRVPLQFVEPRRLYRQIADQIAGLIAAGEFLPGSRLPAERELAAKLGVSRASVREAIISLEIGGLVMSNCYATVALSSVYDGNGWGGIRTPGAFRHTRFPGVHNQPLCHPSNLFVFVLIIETSTITITSTLGNYSCKRRNNSSSGNWIPM